MGMGTVTAIWVVAGTAIIMDGAEDAAIITAGAIIGIIGNRLRWKPLAPSHCPGDSEFQ